jgi:hypothetical protein
MSEVVMEECERAEYAGVVMDLKNFAFSKVSGKVIFRSSRITRNAEFFTSKYPSIFFEAECY